MTWRPGYGGCNTHLTTDGVQERRWSCGDGRNGAFHQAYKAMAGAFWIDDPHYVW